MGYDLHITRGDWSSDDKDPITYEEWRQVAEADPDLAGWSGNEPTYTLRDCDIHLSFYHSEVSGTVHVRGGYFEEVLWKVLELAAKLNAVVQGDEGEYYRLIEQGVETSWE